MGWNGSGGTAKEPKLSNKARGRPYAFRSILCGALVLLGVGVFLLLYFRKTTPDSAAEHSSVKTSNSTSLPVKRKYEAPKRRIVKKTGDKMKDALSEVSAAGELVLISDPTGPSRKREKEAIKPIPFNSGVEQLMHWVFSRRLGEAPMALPSISEDEKKRLAEILASEMEIKEGDSEEEIAVKETIDYAKKEMAKFVGEGGDPDEFLRYYVRQQMLAFDTRMEAQRQYSDLYDEDPEMAAEFAKKANALLAEKGIKSIEEEPEDE